MAVITEKVVQNSWQYLAQQAYYFGQGDESAIARYASNIIDGIQGGDDIPVALKEEIDNLFRLLTVGINPKGSRQEILTIHNAIAHHYGVDTSTEMEMAPDDIAIALDSVPLGWDHV